MSRPNCTQPSFHDFANEYCMLVAQILNKNIIYRRFTIRKQSCVKHGFLEVNPVGLVWPTVEQ